MYYADDIKPYRFTYTQNHTYVNFNAFYRKNFTRSIAHEREITPTDDALVADNKDIRVSENTNI